MALTNFGALTTDQKRMWSKDVWKTARQKMFIMSLAGTGINAPITRIKELTPSEKGDKAIITLVPDLGNDGVTGDTLLWDFEEAIKAFDQTIEIDQLRNANRTAGRMMEQRSVVRFRETSKDLLAFWLADRCDQLAILTMSGLDYRLQTNGKIRYGWEADGSGGYDRLTGAAHEAGRTLYDLSFRSDVTVPSANRHFRWNGNTSKLIKVGDAGGQTNDLSAANDTPSYEMLVELKAFAKDKRIKALAGDNGAEMYHVLMHPKSVAKLKLDADFRNAIVTGGDRGKSNPFFTGAIQTVDGLVIHENTHVFNTIGATAGTSSNVDYAGYKWGANADVDGSRTILLGSQGLAFADLGGPSWEEDDWDYKNQQGISIGKMIGFLKPQFYSPMDSATTDAADYEDYGVICVDHAI